MNDYYEWINRFYESSWGGYPIDYIYEHWDVFRLEGGSFLKSVQSENNSFHFCQIVIR